MGASFEELREVAGYRLAERIGSGGMGEVFKAYNPAINRYAAVKILYQAAFADRFKNEAYIQSSINHPNIARLYEYTTIGDKLCIVMEYVEGESLDKLLARKRKLTNIETEHIIRQVIAALAYLHKREIMHRDIKPQNFKVEPDGTVKMLDFGIAKHAYSPKLTQAGFIVGTMEYLAPEQFQQQPELKSDIWALAVMTYELLTGYMPFESANPVTLQSIIRKGTFTNPAILIPDISNKLSTIIEKGLKVNPANRITAEGIENILGKTKLNNGLIQSIMSRLPSKKILLFMGAGFILLFILLVVVNDSDNKLKQEQTDNASIEKGLMNKIMINTTGVERAEMELTDGTRKQLPFAIEGKEGENIEFTIHAEGYKDKKVNVQITNRRSSYEYNLEKNQ